MKNETKKSATKGAKSVKNVANNYKPKYVTCDFSVLEKCKDLDSLKEWAEDMAAQLKAKYAEVAASLSKTEKAKKTETKTESKKTKESKEEVEQIAITDKKAIKKLGLQFVDYSEKAFAVTGDTKPVKDICIKLKGRFNRNLRCGAGWIFSKRYEDEVRKALVV